MQSRSQTIVSRLDEPILRIIATLSNVGWIVVGALGLLTDNMDLARSVWPAIVISAFAMVQLSSGRNDIRATLIVASVAVGIGALAIPVDGSRAPTVIALAAIGTVLSNYVRTRLVAFVTVYALGMTMVVTWSEPDVVLGLITGLSGAVAFGFTTYLMRWVLLQMSKETERYRSLFDHSPIAMWEEDFTAVDLLLNELRERGDDLEVYLKDNPGAALRIAGLIEVKAANEAAVRLLEAGSPEELLGQLKNREVEALESITRQLLAVWNSEDHVLTEITDARTLLDKRVHLALSWSAPRIHGELDLAHVSVAAVDVTESREARAALEGLVRSKDELVATVSHELRTPLTTVVGLADELSTSLDTFDRNELRDLVSLIASEGREVSTIVEDLLIAAQAETGSLLLNNERFDVVSLARDVHRAVPDSTPVALFVPDQPVWAMADPMRTRQIIRNLVVNAERYGGPAIRICVAVSGATAVVEVRDGGGPLPFKEREAIFDRYYRARQVPGLTASVGLGLTVSRRLGRDMGGDLIYAHDGEEAIFELTLPLYIAQPQTLHARQEAAG
jgi:signal transduction histidine kinase